MLLGPVTTPDLVVYIGLLFWELLHQVGFLAAAAEGISAVPFLVTQLPYQLLRERYFTPPKKQLAWTARSSVFQDAILRCVRYAFTNMDPKVARVFLSKGVALPFLKFRLWRHNASKGGPEAAGWSDVEQDGFKGVLIVLDKESAPDFVLYYIHGGGFSMGSAHFYLEFLLEMASQLRMAGFDNPAIFALDYTLVPEAVYPTQLEEVIAGYEYALSLTNRERLCVGGDSAGGTLVLSLLLHLAQTNSNSKPAFACLLSPWAKLVAERHDSPSDFLNNHQLNHFGRLYAKDIEVDDSIASPGCCNDVSLWKQAMPEKGIMCACGTEGLLYDEISCLLDMLQKAGKVVRMEDDTMHVWPVAVVFLASNVRERQEPIRRVARGIYEHFQ